jgi:CheY-like chemotaxis protein
MLLLFIFKSSGHTKSIENLFHELDATHQELEKTHTDLEEAHQELIDNQARIIENEKLTTARSLTQKLVTRLRSPITSLLLALHRSGDHQTEGNRQFCDHIEDAIHRILKLMDQLGRASGLEQPEGTQELIAATRGLDTSLGEATSSQTVLLIEDEDPIRELLTFVITELGYEVDSVATGEEALTRIQEVNYGLILSDINLPGKSGIDVFREVTRTNPDLKFTFMSGYMLKKEWIPVLKESGAFLQKPCSAEDVGKLLKQALGEAKQEPHLASP